MPLLIDGYNLLWQAAFVSPGRGPGSLARSRLGLLHFLVDVIEPAERRQTTVVFDAAQAPPGLPASLTLDGIQIRFARDHADADELLIELIRADFTPRNLVVVSSDHRVQNAARRRRARPIDSDVWYRQQLAARQARPQAPPAAKPSVPLSSPEVAFWLEAFAIDSNPQTTTRRTDDLFPPDWLAALEKESPPDMEVKVSPAPTSSPHPAPASPPPSRSRRPPTPIRPPRKRSAPKPNAPPPPASESKPTPQLGANPFPPGYAEDLLRPEEGEREV